ncbi:hypothetical protein BT69DRAFT_1580 [Atractiella rhizophila]|nr:hypothetical protein BT69DRAFT_1580 [Atractiella rhizophila]
MEGRRQRFEQRQDARDQGARGIQFWFGRDTEERRRERGEHHSFDNPDCQAAFQQCVWCRSCDGESAGREHDAAEQSNKTVCVRFPAYRHRKAGQRYGKTSFLLYQPSRRERDNHNSEKFSLSIWGRTRPTNSTSTPAFSFGAKPTVQETPKISFGFDPKPDDKTAVTSAPKPTAFAFGAKVEEKNAPQAAAPFGDQPKPAESSKPGFSFGAPASTSGTANTGSPFAFGTQSSETSKPPFSFGTAEKKEQPFGAASSSSSPFTFGSNSTPSSDAPATNITAAPMTFGTANTSTKSPFGTGFGNGSAATSTATASPFSFGVSGTNGNGSESNDKSVGMEDIETPPAEPVKTPSMFAVSNPLLTAAQTVANGPGFSFAGKAQPASSGFSFGAAVTSTTSQPFSAAPKPFSFGQDRKDPTLSPAPFGGAAPTSPFTFGGNNNPSPAPPAPTSPFSFNFGGNASKPASNPSPFGGSQPVNASSPFGTQNQPAHNSSARSNLAGRQRTGQSPLRLLDLASGLLPLQRRLLSTNLRQLPPQASHSEPPVGERFPLLQLLARQPIRLDQCSIWGRVSRPVVMQEQCGPCHEREGQDHDGRVSLPWTGCLVFFRPL